MKRLNLLLEELIGSGFWGEVTIQFKDGRPTLIRKQEQIKIEEETKTSEVTSRKNRRDFHDKPGVGHGCVDGDGCVGSGN